MYENLKRIVLSLLRVDDVEPHPPSGYDPHEFLSIMRACPSYLQYKLFFWKLYAVAWIVGIVVGSIALVIVQPLLVLVVIPGLILAAFKAATLYVVSRLDYEMRWYVITDRSLLIREGVWTVREITLTFANAQNVRVTQGPLQRYFDFSNVEVDTAGGGGGGAKDQQESQAHRAVLRGLKNPNEVRDQILELLRHHRTAGLGDPDDHQHEGISRELLTEILEEAKGVRKQLAMSNE